MATLEQVEYIKNLFNETVDTDDLDCVFEMYFG